MQAMDDSTLLRQYAASGSEAAFETLVLRHLRFVYSAALRQVRDPHLAEEVTQAVFVILAQKAARLSGRTLLSGWLFKTTRFVALAQIRAAARRRHYEQESSMQSDDRPNPPNPLWEEISPLLDEALVQLGSKDRQAVLLRFFEGRSLTEVGRCLGVAEDAARMRISRALEKLRCFFLKRGVTASAAIIAGAISANSVQAAPVALAKTITAAAAVKGAAASGSTLTLIKGALKLVAWTKAKTVIVVGATMVLAGGTTTILFQSVSGSVPVSLPYNCTLDQDTASGEPAERPNDLREFPAGRRQFRRVTFSVHGKLQLASRFPKSAEQFPERAEVMKADKEFKQLHILHGASYSARDGTPIAALVLHYKDGSQRELPVRYGWHVRDWTFNRSPQGDWSFGKREPPPLKPGSEVVWIGSNPFVGPKGEKLRVYKSTFNNPCPKKAVASIEYLSAMTDCAPFLLGMSLE
jgi:RNA polymerase sigma factor (sigma-70 family)